MRFNKISLLAFTFCSLGGSPRTHLTTQAFSTVSFVSANPSSSSVQQSFNNNKRVIFRNPFKRNTMTKSTASSETAVENDTEVKKTLDFEEISPSYKELVTKLRTVTQLKRAQAVLSYDQMVFMPQSDRSSVQRGAQLSALAGLIHEKETDDSLSDLLQTVEKDLGSVASPLRTDAYAQWELAKTTYERNKRVPAELEAKRASLSVSAYSAWVKARQTNDFASFEPILSDCFQTAMDIASARRTDESTPLYSQMMDEFEMGMDSERVDSIFDSIQSKLVPLLNRVMASETKSSTEPLHCQTFQISKQKEMNRKIVTALGFDESHGRIDVSVHPFTTSFSPADVRITSRFTEEEWSQGLMGTIHEGGHAMYEQNLGESGLEIDSALSLGTHESQSLFWERHVAKSTSFWKWATPIVKETFVDEDGGGEFDKFSEYDIYAAINAVSPSLIRVEADELTYPLHVILRYCIERDVVEGKLEVKDIPKRWNEGMKEMLNVDVPGDDKGCLQDMHWPSMAIGYFPTYLIGAATAAQLAHYCEKDIPDMYEQIANGEFSNIKAWMTEKVHKHGKRYKSLDRLLSDQLGEELNPKYFIEYLTNKYSSIYDLQN